MSDGIYLGNKQIKMAGVSNITTHFVLATEDDLSMFNDDADPKNTKKQISYAVN